MQPETSSKKEYWQNHISQWESSKLTQQAYCAQSGIKLVTFVYWRTRLNKLKTNQFIPIEIKQSPIEASIKIKLITGNIICIPANLGIPEIAKLIRLLEMPNA